VRHIPARPQRGHHLGRAVRVSAVCGLGAAVLVSAFALPARAVTVHPVMRGKTRIVPVAARDQGGRKQHVVKRGESLTLIARQAGLSSWRSIYDLNRSISLPDLVYPGQKLALPAKGEKVKHRPLPATLRLATLQRSGAGTGGASGNAPAAPRSSGAVGGTVWDRLAQCESGGNPRAVSSNGQYFGLYQFSLSTWASVGASDALSGPAWTMASPSTISAAPSPSSTTTLRRRRARGCSTILLARRDAWMKTGRAIPLSRRCLSPRPQTRVSWLRSTNRIRPDW